MRTLICTLVLLACTLPAQADEFQALVQRFFARYDADRDGAVTAAELGDARLLARMDSDGDGRITAEDLRSYAPQLTPEDPSQGPKNTEAKNGPAVDDKIRFVLMMAIDRASWARVKPYLRPGDLFWHDELETLEAIGVPAKHRGFVITDPAKQAKTIQDLIKTQRVAHVVMDLRSATPAAALAATQTAMKLLSTPAAVKAEMKLVARYTQAQLAKENRLRLTAHCVSIGPAKGAYSYDQLADDVKGPLDHIIEVVDGDRLIGLVLEGDKMAEKITRCVDELGVAHLWFVCDSKPQALGAFVAALAKFR